MMPIVRGNAQEGGEAAPRYTSSNAPVNPKIREPNVNKTNVKDKTFEFLWKTGRVRFPNKSCRRSRARPDRNSSADPTR